MSGVNLALLFFVIALQLITNQTYPFWKVSMHGALTLFVLRYVIQERPEIVPVGFNPTSSMIPATFVGFLSQGISGLTAC
jgi:hypothetical protein